MDKILLIILISPVILYFIYNIICYKNKKVIYHISVRNKNFHVLDYKYYKLQLIFSTITCILLVFESILLVPKSLETNSFNYLILYALIFYLSNYFLKTLALRNNYAELKK